MKPATCLEVTADGETRRLSLAQFEAENEGSPRTIAIAHSLICSPVGSKAVLESIEITHVSAPARSPRVAKFKTPINPKYKARGATVKINRDTGLISVRLLRRHKEHFFTLQDLAELVYTRSVLAERAKKKKERKGVHRTKRGLTRHTIV